ncbi:MAG: hypothetical protein H6618_10215 [Deltaproteobacteria bacterium]|nr:hypothetical protein [Deltaproteobacteria bacterium]
MADEIHKRSVKKAGKKASSRLRPRSTKGNRTLSLDQNNFEKLAKYCKRNNIPASEVVDELIAAFLDALAE